MELAEFLAESGWSKADLSRKLGVSKSAITQWVEIPEKWVPVLTGVVKNQEIPPEIPGPT